MSPFQFLWVKTCRATDNFKTTLLGGAKELLQRADAIRYRADQKKRDVAGLLT